MSEIKITAQNFESEVIKSETPVLLDFWATWCGPCKMIAPIIEKIAEENEGKIKVGKVNVDDEPMLAGQFGINAIPTIVYFKDGKVIDSQVGYCPKEEIEKMFR